MTEPDETAPTLPGLEHEATAPTGASPVREAYAAAIDELERLGVLGPQHAGLAANLLRVGEIIDRERKGYAVAHATAQAHELMKTLLELVPVSADGDPFVELMRELGLVTPPVP